MRRRNLGLPVAILVAVCCCVLTAAQQGFTFEQMLRIAGPREAVSWYANEINTCASAAATSAGASLPESTAVVAAIDAATGKTTGAAQFGGPPEAVSRVRLALVVRDSAEPDALFRVVASSSADPTVPAVVDDVELLAWVELRQATPAP